MSHSLNPEIAQEIAQALPKHTDLYFGGGWHAPGNGTYDDTMNPANGQSLGAVATAGKADVDAAVAAAHQGFLEWRDVLPLLAQALQVVAIWTRSLPS